MNKCWWQIERRTEACVVLRETLLGMDNIVNMQDERRQGNKPSKGSIAQPVENAATFRIADEMN